MIVVARYSELESTTKNKLHSYITGEFGHIPIVNQTEWAMPDWTIIYYENNQIATFYNVVEREIAIDGTLYKTGGINNVITPKAFRGKGYASKTLKQTPQLLFDDLGCDMGLLLCAEDLVPFYERLDWFTVDCPVYFEQSSGVKLWKAQTMLLTQKWKIRPQMIELNGLPW